ncbi:hypothetical protein SAMN05443575_1937 [Jatrophihabitans endophyticus]|uniref:Uncharacterized protein n=1 Tax=Jatrophihabitans endophyticus TaxID=1206085 RepID=A0A1M5IMQ3_9ACTN|nr:hypothetical protein [Jatrophihabitans endophyticus]SHG29240.1 hypothetical protein SAMN05443575_1937 [Jatrophihabitans endophyticus]
MTEHDNSDPSRGSYGGPPPTEQFRSQPQQQPYQQQSYQQPYQQQPYDPHGYPPQYPTQQPYGYPQQPYGWGQQPGYPPAYGAGSQPGSQRPGLVLAASILAYVNAGMLILAGALLLFGSAIVSDIEDNAGSGTDYGTEFALDGVVNFIAAGLLIAGAVTFTGGKASGRLLLSVGCGIVLATAVYWLVRFNGDRFHDAGDGYIVWAVIFAALAILSLAFSFPNPINRWLATNSGR